MKILDVLNAPWAIEPTKLLEIQSIYATHLRGDKIDLAAVEARIGRPLKNANTAEKSYDIVDGVAIVRMEGVMAKRMNLFAQISGGTSTELLTRDIQSALADSAAHSIILATDTPGGTVDGTQLLADAIRAAGQQKKIVTLGSGAMCSAGYWAGSAANQVYITDGTTNVGSIGVVTSHVDVSAQEQARGVKTTEITAGKYKRIASQYGPLSDEGRQSIQDQLDYMYSLFVAAVAKNRGVSVDQVLANMADGRVFIGQQAIDAGLVDGVFTMAQLIVKLNQDRTKITPTKRAGAAPTSTQPKGKNMLTAEQVASEHPEAAAALRAEGAVAERERIQGIEAQLIPGHEAVINKLKFDGTSSPGDAAKAIVCAERNLRQAAINANASDAPPVVVTVPQTDLAAAAADAAASGKETAALTKEELDAKAKQHMADNPGTSYVDAYKAVGGR